MHLSNQLRETKIPRKIVNWEEKNGTTPDEPPKKQPGNFMFLHKSRMIVLPVGIQGADSITT